MDLLFKRTVEVLEAGPDGTRGSREIFKTTYLKPGYEDAETVDFPNWDAMVRHWENTHDFDNIDFLEEDGLWKRVPEKR